MAKSRMDNIETTNVNEEQELRKKRKILKKLAKETNTSTKTLKRTSKSHQDEQRSDLQQQPRGKRLKSFHKNVGGSQKQEQQLKQLPDLRYILAPMVGASELAFRLLCRKYGATLAYTPMMDAARFATDESYRLEQLGISTTRSESATLNNNDKNDRPLVCHFNANTSKDFAAAAVAAAPYCDAVDLNLGCPQRAAHVGHFGSYLLGPEDRSLVLAMIAAANRAVPHLPICCKIRLLDTVEETTTLVQELHEAGASWIAIHARYRATWDRKGPGARDGPALLDQIAVIREQLPHVKLIANGNIQSFDDCKRNLELTKADGVMSAEGILDNPALFLPRFGTDLERVIDVPTFNSSNFALSSIPSDECSNKLLKLEKKLRNIEKLEAKVSQGMALTEKQALKLSTKTKLESKALKLQLKTESITNSHASTSSPTTQRSLAELTLFSSEKVNLAKEYLDLVRQHPIAIRTIIFHIRRMLRDELIKYQLMDDCVSAPSLEHLQEIVNQVHSYQHHPSSFHFDKDKAASEKLALERKKHEEGKRKRFEDRMRRKAKREGKEDLEFYLQVGAVVPSKTIIAKLKTLSLEDQLVEWKKHHSQHCMAHHLSTCKRDRGCAFLHVEPQDGRNSFVESDEVAG